MCYDSGNTPRPPPSPSSSPACCPSAKRRRWARWWWQPSSSKRSWTTGVKTIRFCQVLLRDSDASGYGGLEPILVITVTRKVDVRLQGKGNSNSHGARPIYLIITMIKWIRTSRLSIQNYLSKVHHGCMHRAARPRNARVTAHESNSANASHTLFSQDPFE